METPGRVAFDDWKRLLEQNKNLEVAKQFSDDVRSGNKSVAHSAEELVVAMYANREEHTEAARKHEVWRWLVGEPAYKKAESMMFRRMNGGLTIDEAIARRVATLKGSGDRGAGFSVRRWAEQLSPAVLWPSRVLEAVDEYLHVDLDARFRARKAASPKVEKMHQLFLQVRDDLELDVNDPRIGRLGRDIETLRMMVDRYPKRDQQNKKERQFVMRVAQENQRYGNRTMKPQVISELMSLSCFKRQLDLRTIARICSDMTASEKKRQENVMAKPPG